MQMITFTIGEEAFAVDIMAIREIRAWTPATRLPHSPHYIVGVVNLRGTVLPVMDLASRLGWGTTEASSRHVIIVTRVREQFRGLIVDSVSDIITLDDEQVQPPPPNSHADANFIKGIATVEDRLITILDLEALADEDLEAMAA